MSLAVRHDALFVRHSMRRNAVIAEAKNPLG